MTPSIDFPPPEVISFFAPHARGLKWARAGAGFSGASVWRGSDGAPRAALKAWPPGTAPERLRQIHAWMARASHLPFVPAVFPGAAGETVCVADGRAWDCCRWQPGAPRLDPTQAEVEAACEAVARLHEAWAGEPRRGPCPGVLNRLHILAENERLLFAGPGALPPVSPGLDPLLRRAADAAARAAPRVAGALRPWARRPLALQACVRDLRAEHVLFEGERVAGVIDFGAAAMDHPAVDLARLFVDFAEVDSPLAAGLAAYRRVRAAPEVTDEFVRLLAQSGAACSVVGWLVRLAVRREPISDSARIAARLGRLVAIVEAIPHDLR